MSRCCNAVLMRSSAVAPAGVAWLAAAVAARCACKLTVGVCSLCGFCRAHDARTEGRHERSVCLRSSNASWLLCACCLASALSGRGGAACARRSTHVAACGSGCCAARQRSESVAAPAAEAPAVQAARAVAFCSTSCPPAPRHRTQRVPAGPSLTAPRTEQRASARALQSVLPPRVCVCDAGAALPTLRQRATTPACQQVSRTAVRLAGCVLCAVHVL